MADKAREWTDKKLAKMEREIAKVYKQAEKEMREKWNAYMLKGNKRISALEKDYRDALKVGDEEIIADIKKRLEKAKESFTLQNDHYKAMVDSLTLDMAQVNNKARAYINGELPEIYAKNYVQANEIVKDMQLSFTLPNENAIKNRILEGKVKTPYMRTDNFIKIPKDQRWNTKFINSQVLQGIIQGEDMRKIANRIFPEIQEKTGGLPDHNRAAAIRNARTLVTGAENQGKHDSYKDLSERGVVMKQVWIATGDDRTRESHLEMDGQEVDIGEPFIAINRDGSQSELMYPADPNGDAEQVYNCRCALTTRVVGFRNEDGTIRKIEEEDEGQDLHDRQIAQEKSRRAQEAEKKQVEEEQTSENQTLLSGLRENYAYHATKNNLRVVEEKDVKDEFFNGDLSRLSNETEQAFSGTFNNLMSEYDTPLTTIRTMSMQESLNNKAFATTHHNYEIDNAEIIINPIKCKDAEKLSERLADLMDRGYAVKIDDPMQYVPTHEFAHTLFSIGEKLNNSRNFVGADYDKIRKVRKEVLSVYDKYTKEINDITNRAKKHESDFIMNFSEESAQKAREEFKKLDAIRISRYSLTNSDEFMAEAFTQYKLGKNKSPYADMIGKIIDDNFKR